MHPIKTRGKGHSTSGKNNGIKLGRPFEPAVDDLSGKDRSYKLNKRNGREVEGPAHEPI